MRFVKLASNPFEGIKMSRQIIYLHPDTVTVKASCREGTPDESDGNGGCMR